MENNLANQVISYNVSFCTFRGTQFDASTTNLTYEIPAPVSAAKSIPPLEVIISFLSPITPTSTLRQSIPASYMTVHVSGSFDVDIYVDVNGQWVSGNRASEIVWEFGQQELAEGKGLKTWKIRRETEQLLSEWRDQAEWGTLHFSAPAVGSAHTISLLDQADQVRMSVMNLGYLDFCVLDSPVQEHYRTLMTTTTVVSWKKSLCSHLLNHSL